MEERNKCIYFAPANERKRCLHSSNGCELKRKFLKKNFKNIWRIKKTCLTFATAFASKTARDEIRNQGGLKALRDKEFFEDIEQLRKFYSLLLKE